MIRSIYIKGLLLTVVINYQTKQVEAQSVNLEVYAKTQKSFAFGYGIGVSHFLFPIIGDAIIDSELGVNFFLENNYLPGEHFAGYRINLDYTIMISDFSIWPKIRCTYSNYKRQGISGEYISPEAGITLVSVFSLCYGYNIPINSPHQEFISRHSLSLYFTLGHAKTIGSLIVAAGGM